MSVASVLSGVDTPTSNASRKGMKNTVYLFGAIFLIQNSGIDVIVQE